MCIKYFLYISNQQTKNINDHEKSKKINKKATGIH